MMKRFGLIIGFLFLFVSLAAAQGKGGAGTAASTTDAPVGKHYGKAERGNGLMGSGGMNFHYNGQTGLYTKGRTMRKNLIGFWGDASYSAMYTNMPGVQFLPGGYSASAGFVYEYEHYNVCNIQTGLGLRWQSVVNSVEAMRYTDASVVDKQGYPYTLVYDFTDRQDRSKALYVQVPLLVGSYVGPFYYRAGVKVQAAIYKAAAVRTTITTTAVYDQFIGSGTEGSLQEMDNHGLRKDVPVERVADGWLSVRPDLLLSAEIGYEKATYDDYRIIFKHRKVEDTRFRVALFADWGMLNLNPSTRQALYVIPENAKWDFGDFSFNHVFSTSLTEGKHIHNFFVGVKLTVLVGFPIEQKCILCGPFRSEVDYR